MNLSLILYLLAFSEMFGLLLVRLQRRTPLSRSWREAAKTKDLSGTNWPLSHYPWAWRQWLFGNFQALLLGNASVAPFLSSLFTTQHDLNSSTVTQNKEHPEDLVLLYKQSNSLVICLSISLSPGTLCRKKSWKPGKLSFVDAKGRAYIDPQQRMCLFCSSEENIMSVYSDAFGA